VKMGRTKGCHSLGDLFHPAQLAFCSACVSDFPETGRKS
jgi:hypothetical protein